MSMKTVPLSEYLAEIGTQQVLANALGVQQSAVSQMARSGRNIEVIIHEDGRIEAQELRPIPARPRKSAA
jgi:DNA-binding transcriptional regulator YdaS (Cro superfamily)